MPARRGTASLHLTPHATRSMGLRAFLWLCFILCFIVMGVVVMLCFHQWPVRTEDESRSADEYGAPELSPFAYSEQTSLPGGVSSELSPVAFRCERAPARILRVELIKLSMARSLHSLAALGRSQATSRLSCGSPCCSTASAARRSLASPSPSTCDHTARPALCSGAPRTLPLTHTLHSFLPLAVAGER